MGNFFSKKVVVNACEAVFEAVMAGLGVEWTVNQWFWKPFITLRGGKSLASNVK